MTELTIQGLATHVEISGEGEPMIFIHGNPDDAHMWDDVMAHMPSGFQFIAPDLPGFGQSSYREDIDYSIRNRGQWVADALDALSIDTPVIVVAHDHGGVFGASFAVQYPERVKALVLQNTLFHREYNWHPMGKIWRTPILGELNIKLIAVPALSMPVMHQYVKWGAPDLTYEHTRAMFARFSANEHMGKSMLKLYRDSNPEDLAGWDDKLYAFAKDKPTLVLWGKQDKYLPMAFPEKLQTHGAKLVVFEDAGHWLALTQPEAYADEMTKFLDTLR